MTVSPAPGPQDRPWIQGIRPRLADDVWQRLVQSTLLLTFIDQPPGANTAETEAALGFVPCAYWYLCRSEARFGSVVFLWRTTDGEPFRPGDGAVAPFDTGGLWHGHRTTPTPTTSAAGRHGRDCRRSFTISRTGRRPGRRKRGW